MKCHDFSLKKKKIKIKKLSSAAVVTSALRVKLKVDWKIHFICSNLFSADLA